MTIISSTNVPVKDQLLFLGPTMGLQRYDKFKYPIFFDLTMKQMEFMWKPNEISLVKDKVDYEQMQPHEKHIFTSNLLFQTTLDSIVSRGIPSLLNYVTNPELEFCCKWWEAFETLHSYSYTYIVRNLYASPEVILDSALENPEIASRSNSVKKAYDELNDAVTDVKSKIYLALISMNMLEAVRFYVSFVCAFAFGENKKMIGNADIIKLIRRDEAVHLSITQNVLNILKNNEEEGFQGIIKENEDYAIKIFEDGAKEEKAWASYLFKDGSILGLNEKILSQYIEWCVDSRMSQIGLPKLFNVKRPSMSWVEPWMDSAAVQVAPQESEITSYKIGASSSDLKDVDFSELSL